MASQKEGAKDVVLEQALLHLYGSISEKLKPNKLIPELVAKHMLSLKDKQKLDCTEKFKGIIVMSEELIDMMVSKGRVSSFVDILKDKQPPLFQLIEQTAADIEQGNIAKKLSKDQWPDKPEENFQTIITSNKEKTNWIDQIPDKTPLCMLSVPGFVSPKDVDNNAVSIENLFRDGIRCFNIDIQNTEHTDGISMLQEVLDGYFEEIKHLLEENTNEFVLIHVLIGNHLINCDDFSTYLESQSDILWIPPSEDFPIVCDVRGKIVLLNSNCSTTHFMTCSHKIISDKDDQWKMVATFFEDSENKVNRCTNKDNIHIARINCCCDDTPGSETGLCTYFSCGIIGSGDINEDLVTEIIKANRYCFIQIDRRIECLDHHTMSRIKQKVDDGCCSAQLAVWCTKRDFARVMYDETKDMISSFIEALSNPPKLVLSTKDKRVLNGLLSDECKSSCLDKLVSILEEKSANDIQAFVNLLKYKQTCFSLGCYIENVLGIIKNTGSNKHTVDIPVCQVNLGGEFAVKISMKSKESRVLKIIEANKADFDVKVLKLEVNNLTENCIKIDINVANEWELQNMRKDIECGIFTERLCQWLKNKGEDLPPEEEIVVQLVQGQQVHTVHPPSRTLKAPKEEVISLDTSKQECTLDTDEVSSIRVTGFNQHTPSNDIREFVIELMRGFGGTQHISYSDEQKTAIITFEDHKAAENVLHKLQGKPILFKEKHLAIHMTGPKSMQLGSPTCTKAEILEHLVDTDTGTQHFVNKFFKETLCEIRTKAKDLTVSITGSEHKDRPGFLVKGNKESLSLVVQEVTDLVASITCKVHSIREAVLPPVVEKHITSLEARYKTVIETEYVGNLQIKSEPKHTQIAYRVFINKWKSIYVRKGDLTCYQVDAVVTSANESLLYYGGLAGALITKGGTSIQDECSRYIDKKGPLSFGEVFVSKPGVLPCKYIIHATSPEWQGGRDNEKDNLRKTIFGALKAAADQHCKTVALPALSCGTFGFPVKRSCQTIVEVVREYLANRKTTLEEIHLVDIDESTVEAFYWSLLKQFGRDSVENINLQEINVRDASAEQKCKLVSPENYQWVKLSDNSYQTLEGIKVSILNDDMTPEIVDVTDTDINEMKGFFSVVAVAGVSTKDQNRLPYAGASKYDYTKSRTSDLNCAAVYHGQCTNDALMYQDFVGKCLVKASRKGMTVVAFTIGNELAKSGPNVAIYMFDAVNNFSKHHKETSLTDIKFIVSNQDTSLIKVFTDEMAQLILGNKNYNVGHLHMTHCLVTVAKGDITTEKVQAIVTSTNSHLDFSSQVSKAILKKGGDEIAEECEQIGSVNEKHLAFTSAGNLPCQLVIHVAVPNPPRHGVLIGYYNEWKTRIKDVLEEANQRGYKSIAVPALGTRLKNIDSSVMASTLLDAFYEFNQRARDNLTAIRVIVVNDETADLFMENIRIMETNAKGFMELVCDRPLQRHMSAPDGCSGKEDPFLAGSKSSLWHTLPSKRRECQTDSAVIFHVYGVLESEINQVVEEIDELCQKGQHDEFYHSMQDASGSGLGMQNTKHLEYMDTHSTMDQPSSPFESFKEQLDVGTNKVQWKYDVVNDFEPDVNEMITNAYQEQQESLTVEMSDTEQRKTVMIISISDMTISDIRTPSIVMPISRHILGNPELPTSWSPMNNEPLVIADLNEETHEFKHITQKFRNSLELAGVRCPSIVKVQRIQNASSYQTFQKHKMHMEEKNFQDTENEKVLWYGSSEDMLTDINTSGFYGCCGKHGTQYGYGIYFTTNAATACEHAKVNRSGMKHVYSCQVLTGEFTKANKNISEPPAKDPNQPNLKYDSVADSVSCPRIFVIFNASLAYPQYLITFIEEQDVLVVK